MNDKSDQSGRTVYLIDSSGYIFRAYHAIRGNLSMADGTPTQAVYGFTTMLLKLIREEQPYWLVPVFDVSRRSFRQDLLPSYKANRPPAPEDLIAQIPLIHDVVEAFGFPAVELEGFEADDVIGTLAEKLAGEGYEVRIVTSDKDFMQLVSERIRLVDTWKNKVVREPEVLERFGVEPGRVIDVMGLAGDTSDNVPGVPGIGEKTASQLIQEFGSLEAVLENIDRVKGTKRKQNLHENAEMAKLSKDLVTIRRDAPVSIDLDNYVVRPPDSERLVPLFTRLEFRTLLKTLNDSMSSEDETVSEPAPESALDRSQYVLVSDVAGLDKLIETLDKSSLIAFDTETRGKNPLMSDPLVGMSFSPSEGEAYYVPVAHSFPGTVQVPKAEVLQRLRLVFENPDKTWIMQNAKFDLQVMHQEGVTFAGTVEDTMLMSYAENPAQRQHGLDYLAMDCLGHAMIPFSEVCGKGKNQITFDQVDIQTALGYAAEDADATYRLYHVLAPRLEEAGLMELYTALERPLAAVLERMERAGFLVDRAGLEALTRRFDELLVGMETEIYELAEGPFNINSTQQLAEILFDKLGLPHGRKTKTGYSTDSSVLENLAGRHPLPAKILEYRQAAKLKSTYTDALIRLINPDTGRVHTSFNQTVTLTGRLSSSDPNLQNIPVRTEAGRLIRRAFIAPPGSVLLAADYSQVELRILAHLSGDPIMTDAFEKGEDVHTRTAAEVFDTMAVLVDREMRRRAKAVNFGIVYGQTAFGLAGSLGIPQREAKTIIDNYFARYSGVKTYIDEQQERALREKEVRTLFGRRIPLPDIDARNQQLRGYNARVAINAPIQGTAADIIKKAMIVIDNAIRLRKLKSRMLLQVHDELVFEVPEAELDELRALVVESMEGAAELSVSLKVDVGVGENWEVAH